MSVVGAFVVVVVLPHSQTLDAFSHWCWNTVLPWAGVEFEVSGHQVGDAATLIPTLMIGTSLLIVLLGVAGAIRAIGRVVSDQALGSGPRDSVILGGSDVVLGSAGITHPRILVSAGALIELQDDELAAGLAHEQGHIVRRHRFFMLFAEVCRGLSRFLPGTQRAVDALAFHLERDADRWAMTQRHEPAALARAICKASSAFPASASYARLDGGCVSARVTELVSQATDSEPSRPLRALAASMVAFALLLIVSAPAAGAAGLATLAKDHPAHQCDHHTHHP